MRPTTFRRSGYLLLAGATVLSLAGCGTASPRTADFGDRSLPPVREDVAPCAAAMLDGDVSRVESAAGKRHATLRIVNTGLTECALRGYGNLQLVGAEGEQLPTNLRRTGEPAQVVLQPGERAVQDLRWSAPAGQGGPADERCVPAPAAVMVTPPSDTETLRVSWPAGAVCDHGRIELTPWHPPREGKE
ncbi:DUF4232 domain-containing protein [Qaidamihabitans albus]|uniref:DUF4232 domain-containing protein n=1 Tax=Qaidamihabitans albus TaxID=2795733 RepID=UPI0018F20F52|nr:DUF4232 domain-containing protein [Qaidamihabitans albus]